MLKEILEHPKALIMAIAIHLLVVMVFIVSFSWTDPPTTQEAGVPVQLIQEIPPLALNQPAEPYQAPVLAEKRLDTVQKKVEISASAEQTPAKPVIDKSSEILAAELSRKKMQQLAEKRRIKKKRKAAEKLKKAKEAAKKKAIEKSKKKKALKEKLEKKKEAEKIAIAKKEKAQKEAEAKKKQEEDKKAAEEKAKKDAEDKKKAEAAKKAAEIKAKKDAKDKKIRENALKKWKEKKRKEKEKKIADKKKAKEEAEKKKKDAKLAKEKAEKEKKAKAEEQKKKKEEEAKKKATVIAKKKAKSSWGSKIISHVKRRWNPPPGTQGMSAEVRITVSPSGYIRGPVKIVSCDGHPSFCDSIKQAYKDAEPLPRPSRNDLDRNFLITMDDK